MKIFWIFIYNFVIYPFLFVCSLFLSLFHLKLREAILGKFKSINVLEKFFNENYNNQDIYWFHSSSLGEFYQLKPIIEGLRKVENDAKYIVSFSSPSGYNNAISDAIDLKFYMPFDFPWTVIKILNIIKPKKIIFSSYDYWPNFVWIAKLKSINTIVLAKAIKKRPAIFWYIIKSYYKSVYSSLSSVYTISKNDTKILHKIMDENSIPTIKALGNPRYDTVMSSSIKYKEKKYKDISKRPKRIIIGSTHKQDDEFLIPSLVFLMNKYSDLNVVYAPHEPSNNTIKEIKNRFKEHNYTCMLFNKKTDFTLTNDRIILIGVVGVLSELYWQGMIAYIGGGYSSGIHNVMEPAVAKLPVLFGPRYQNADEAKQLLSLGGGFCINNKDDFVSKIEQLILDKKQLRISSLASYDLINRNIGSSNKIISSISNE